MITPVINKDKKQLNKERKISLIINKINLLNNPKFSFLYPT